MRALFLLLSTLSLLSAGCAADRGIPGDGTGTGGSVRTGGVWLISLGLASDGGGSATCDENLSNAQCPNTTPPPPPDPEWTGSGDAGQSPELFFVQILGGGGSDAFLIVDQEVFPGSIQGDQMLFEWTHSVTSDSTSTHVSGYTYELNTDSSTTTRYELVRDGSGLTGRRIDTTTSTWDSSETDEWSVGDVGFSSGQLNAWSYLQGDASNNSNQSDCSGNTCTVSIFNEASVEYSLSGFLTDYDDATYDLLRNVGQDAGGEG